MHSFTDFAALTIRMALISPYNARTSAKIRMTTIPMYRRVCCIYALTPASPVKPIAYPDARAAMPVEMPAPKNRKAEYGLRGDESTIAMQLRKKMITIPEMKIATTSPYIVNTPAMITGRMEVKMRLGWNCPIPEMAAPDLNVP